PQWGWRSVLLLGGTTPLVLTVLIALLLPESVRYMVAKNQPVERIRSVLHRIAETVPDATSFVMHEIAAATAAKSSIGMVVSSSYLVVSVSLWVAYFMGLVIFYALINWMPLLFRDAGLAPQTAALISALFPLGGRRRDPLRLADGSLQCQRDHRGRFRADRRGRLCDRPIGRQPRTTSGGSIRGRHPHEYVPIVATRAGRRLLSDAGARDRRGLDAWPGPLLLRCRLLSRSRARAP